MPNTSPAFSAVAIVNGTAITSCRGIYVGVGGDISITMLNQGTAVIFKGAVTGTIIPVQATMVNTSGTTATDLVALF